MSNLVLENTANYPEEIKKVGGFWEDKAVIVDKNLVASRWPMDLPDFMREVMKMVVSKHP